MPRIEDFAQHTVKADTGYESETLQYIWDKYNAWNGSAPGSHACCCNPSGMC